MARTEITSEPAGRSPTCWWRLPFYCLVPAFVSFSAFAAEDQAKEQATAGDPATHQIWLDRMQSGIHRTVWRSAMTVDRMFGSAAGEEAYKKASGSLAPAVLWSEFDGFQSQLRFRADVPLPQLNERFSAFIGRVNPEEYVTERNRQSGAFPRRARAIDEDQTIFGISYREPPRLGGRFDAGAGVRVRFPVDPYVKGSYVYALGSLDRVLMTLRETAFWQNSEQFGLTSRANIEHVAGERWMFRWTGSGTFSQESQGVRGYTTFTVLHGLSARRAMALELGMDGESGADVPLREYGVKVAYRRLVSRDWLVLELRTSVTWPKELPEQPREASWGLGVGFEIMFGDETFLARPTTF